MAENPLLPDTELRALYAHLKHCIALDEKSSKAGKRIRGPASRSALVAACTLQLGSGDLLVAPSSDATLSSLAPASRSVASLPLFDTKTAPLLLVATAMAAGLRAAGSQGLVLCSVQSGSAQPEWTAALRWAQTARLPLVVACADPSGFTPTSPRVSKLDSSVWSWPSVRMEANRLQFPILTVDGEDAVAVYRCMQESALRARAGGGPALLWATLPSPRHLRKPRTPNEQPLGRLRVYLRARKIPIRVGP